MRSRYASFVGFALMLISFTTEAQNTLPATGNIGIGTTSPGSALTVVGNNHNAYAGDTATFSSNLGTSSTVGNQVNITNVASNWGLLAGFDGLGVATSAYHGANASYLINVLPGPLNLGVNNGVNMTITSSGNVGIGTTNPGATLEVNGSVRLSSGSTGGITFADGSVQTSAVTAQTQAGGASIAGLVLDNTYTNPCTTTYHAYKIATLIAGSAGTYDHLHLFVTLNNSWLAATNSYLDAAFANRSGFNYSYTIHGSAVGTTAKLTAYQNSSGGVDIYIQDYGCSNTSYSIIENQQETVYPNPVDYGSSIAGTLVFDSSSNSYLPSTFTSYSGNLGIGTTAPSAKLEVAGNVKLTAGSGASVTYQDGSVQSTAWNGVLGGGDYAESVDVGGDRTKYEPGDVLVIDPVVRGRFVQSSKAYSTTVAGIYSTKPGVRGRRQLTALSEMKEEVPMAMIGIVPTKVCAEGGPIALGDLLVTSSTPGYAMKGSDRARLSGAVVGKAMSDLKSGTGVIEVLVSLQ